MTTEELRVGDILTFLTVCRLGSVSAAARERRVSASQVSKAIRRLERSLGRPLLMRRARGVVVHEESGDLVTKLEAVAERIQELEKDRSEQRTRRITVGAPSYLAAVFVPQIVLALPDTRVRALEVTPSFMRAFATQNLFEMALTLGAEKMASRWMATRVAKLRRGLFASPSLARRLGSRTTVAKIRTVPFVTPVYSSGGEFLPGDDGCPLPRSERVLGHEAATIGVAFEIAAAADQLAFGPVLAARPLVVAGRLVELTVTGWRLNDDLFLHTDLDRVAARVQSAVIGALQRAVERA